MAFVAKKIIRWKYRGRQPTSRKFCAIVQNTHFCVSFSSSIFSLGCIKTPWGWCRQVWCHFSAFIVDETFRFCLSMFWAILKLLASDSRRVSGSSAKFEVFSRQFFKGGAQHSQVGFQAWRHTRLVCKFRGDPLRDGWDPLSRNFGLNQTTDQPTNRPIKNKNSSGDEIANVNVYAVRPEATRIRWNNAK